MPAANALPHPAPDAPFALLREMAQAPGILASFDANRFSQWQDAAARSRRIFITGEGSSRIFPAKNAQILANRYQPAWTLQTQGARQALEMSLDDHMIVGLSNSGRTRELIALSQARRALYAITADAASPLADGAEFCAVLSCGAEQAVAATKSVIEQALIVQALLGPAAFDGQAQAAADAAMLMSMDLPADLAEAIAGADTVYIAGRNDGVAEELALKTCEIARRKSCYLEGTYVLHGIEEVMTAQDVVVLIEPYREEIARYQDVLQRGVRLPVLAIASFDTPFATLRIPAARAFSGYLQLMAGWRLLAAAGLLRGVDIDTPARARKIGNAVEAT